MMRFNTNITKGFSHGFSYVELMFSIAILAMLAAAATPYLEKTIQRKKESELRENLRDIRNAIDAYKLASDQGKILKTLNDSGYPKSLDDLVLGVPNQTDPQKKKLKFLRNLPADPMFPSQLLAGASGNTTDGISPQNTWGKRSYDSDADDPREGADVFDVHSFNPQKGLNGISYQQW
jgi:general secretion pathway protein G